MNDIISTPTFYYLNVAIKKIVYTFLHIQNIKIRAQNNHVGKVNGSFFKNTPTSQQFSLFTHEWMNNYFHTDVCMNNRWWLTLLQIAPLTIKKVEKNKW